MGWIFFLPAGAFKTWFGYFKDLRPPAHRVPSKFRVSPTEIDSNGHTVAKDDIHRLIIENGINSEVLGNPNVLIAVNAPTAMGIAHRAKVATIANGLEVETGGKSYLLAGGMGATTAFGLLHAVSKVMGLAIH